MRWGPIQNGDCLPFYLEINEEWFGQKLAEYIAAGKDPADIVADELHRGMCAEGERVLAEMKRMQRG